MAFSLVLSLLTKLDCEASGKGAFPETEEENEYVLLFSIGLGSASDLPFTSDREDVIDLGMSATAIGTLLMLIPYGLVDMVPVVSPDLGNEAPLFPNNPQLSKLPAFDQKYL